MTTVELAHECAAQARRENYASELYAALGEVAGMNLPDKAVSGIVRHFPMWEYGVEQTRWGESRYLTRHMDPSALVAIPEQQHLDIERDAERLKLTAGGIKGIDLRLLLDIEGQFLDPADKTNVYTKKDAIRRKFRHQAIDFHDAKDEYLHAGDLFTDKEAAVLSISTHFSSYGGMATALVSSTRVISRTLESAGERTGVDPDMDLMLLAISLGIASTDHIPKGRTDCLDGAYLELLSKYYSPNPKERKAIRDMPKGGITAKWKKIVSKLGGVDKHTALLCAVKDGALQLPSAVNKH
ncbi:MAG: hypothetical protein JWO35_407 [Candidatus Saccharibacteria bacterium]|nr:hypothetical protein [Candidatus Saccharibacteria bacterium]